MRQITGAALFLLLGLAGTQAQPATTPAAGQQPVMTSGTGAGGDAASGALTGADRAQPCANAGKGGAGLSGGTGNARGPEGCVNGTPGTTN